MTERTSSEQDSYWEATKEACWNCGLEWDEGTLLIRCPLCGETVE